MKCPRCGRDLTPNTADACPGCYPAGKPKVRKGELLLLVLVNIPFVVIFCWPLWVLTVILGIVLLVVG